MPRDDEAAAESSERLQRTGDPEAAIAYFEAVCATQYGWTPLHESSYKGHLKATRLLLGRRADPKARNNKGYTPLHYSSYNNHLEVTQLLLESGADPMIKNNVCAALVRASCVMCVCVTRRRGMAPRLLVPMAECVLCVPQEGRTALDYAQLWKYREVAELLQTWMRQ